MIRWVAVFLLLCSGDLWAATRFALVVGNNLGNAEDGALRWAEQDARRVHGIFVELAGVAPEHAVLLLGDDADGVRRALTQLRSQVEQANQRGLRTELLVFYSGHGDDITLHLGPTFLSLDELKQELEAIPVEVAMAIVDACRTGALKRGRGKGAVHAPAFDISILRAPGPKGRVMMTSAGADEVAQESDELRGSFFTHHMLSGLRGGADVDSNGLVTLAELYRYSYHHTLTASHGVTAAVQHPEMSISLEGEGELVITELGRSDSRLVLAPVLEGDLLVVNDRSGHVEIEIHKAKGEQITLALPTGRFRIQLRRHGRVFAAEISLEWGGTRELANSTLTEQPLLAALEKGAALDPIQWEIGAFAVLASAAALHDSMLWGGGVSVERQIGDWPFLVVSRLEVGHASSRMIREYGHVEIRPEFGVGLAHTLVGPLRMVASVAGGGVFVRETVWRSPTADSAKTSAQQTSWTVGPSLSAVVGVRLPLGEFFSLSLTGSGAGSWLRVNERRRRALGWRASFGLLHAL